MPVLVLAVVAIAFLSFGRSRGPNWNTPAGQSLIDATAEREVALAREDDTAETITLRVARALYPRSSWPPADGTSDVEIWNKLLTVVTLVLAERHGA